ncbi:heavy metal translocating P-type ATPase, partial [Desulfobulbus sp. TB]|nr:heavy metal translocating P-type ATPase [Desulfobulbus sp. TB]
MHTETLFHPYEKITAFFNTMLPIPLIAAGFASSMYAAEKIDRYIEKIGKSEQHKQRLRKIKTFFKEVDDQYQRTVQERIDPLFGNAREEQMQELDADREQPEVSEEEKKENRRLAISAANLTFAGTSALLCPTALTVTFPISLYLGLHHYKAAYRSLIHEHRINIALVDSIGITIALLGNFLLPLALGIFLFTISRKMLARTKGSSQTKLINVFSKHPRSVWIQANNAEIEIPFEKLRTGDVFVVRAGEVIPADGIILEGAGAVDEHTLTGEAQAAEKENGEQVLASTVLLSGKIHVQAEKAGQETAAAKIGEMLNRTIGYKTSLESSTEQLVDRSTLPVLAISALAYPFAGTNGALAVLMSYPGYNMRIVAPLTTLNRINRLSEKTILIKDGTALERILDIDTVVFDKTGTLTLEQPTVDRLHPYNGFTEETLLTYAAAAEHRQTHPVARAILTAAEQHDIPLHNLEDTFCEVGYGVKGSFDGKVISIGSKRFMEMEKISVPDTLQCVLENAATHGHSVIMVAADKLMVGAIELRPTVREEVADVTAQLRKRGITTYIVSGDHEYPTRALAEQLHIDHYVAETLPGQKAEIVAALRKEGKKVCFIGDGINDAPALKEADVSVSLRGATSAAVDTAQVILMDGSLSNLIDLFDASQDFAAAQKKNLLITTVPAVICIGGVF